MIILFLLFTIIYCSPWDKINYKCENDDDCSVMNTHNCYRDGYYKECVNKDSIIPSMQQVRPFWNSYIGFLDEC